MSPKKKPAPNMSAPKDDLIDALYESESGGRAALGKPHKSQTQTETVSRLAEFARRVQKKAGSRPPPPPPADPNDRIYNFDEATSGKGSTSLELEDLKTVVRAVDANEDDSEYGNISVVAPEVASDDAPEVEAHFEDIKDVSEVAEKVAEVAEEKSVTKTPPPAASLKPGDRLQKIEDVLSRLKSPLSSKNAGPLYDSDTANAAMSAHKKAKGASDSIEDLAPPPNKPAGVVAKAIYSHTNSEVSTDGERAERAPTAPVPSPPISIDPNVDEKTVAVEQTPQPKAARGVKLAPPVWQDAKTEVLSLMTDAPEADPEAEQFMPTEIRPNSPGARFREEARQAQPGAAIFSSAEAALRQSENLRVAQKRISDLENELERVRRENESLRSAGETLRRRMDELQASAETAELNTQEAKKIAEEERKVLKGQIQSRDREISEMKGRIDDAENRLESNFRKIRVRERDLEHRIEIIKAESQSIAASKDRMILELKRQIDQISSELAHSKAQLQETFGQFKEKQETARRAVRALRIALTVLEGEEDSGSRKAE